MSKKAQLSQMHKDLGDLKGKEAPKAKKKPSLKKEEKASLEAHIPRGERQDFLRITLTIPGNLLTELRMLGVKRKAAKMKDTDTSSLIREALVVFLNKHKDKYDS
jgi:hypothetical protein